MYIQLYAIPAQIFIGIIQQFIYQQGSLYYVCFTLIQLSINFVLYNNNTQLFPKCIWMIIPFQNILVLLDFDMISVGVIPYLVITDLINADIILRLPRKPIPPPRRTFNAQIDNHHTLQIQNVINQNAKSLRKYEYFHIICITLCYLIIPKYNYTVQMLNTAFLQYFYKPDYNKPRFKIIITIFKLALCLLTFDLRAILTVAILPNFINEQKIYSYSFLLEQFIISFLEYDYGIYHNLIIFLSFYIFDSQNKNSKKLTLLYIPLLIYAFESQSSIYIYTYTIMCFVYFALLILEQEKQVLYLRYILIIVGIYITQKWYYKLLIWIFLFDSELNFYLKIYIQCFAGKQILDFIIQYSPFLSYQFFNYKYEQTDFNIYSCLFSIITLFITNHIHQENLIFSRILQFYLLSLPLWPVILYYDRSIENIMIVILNIVQILMQFQKEQ